MIGIHLPQFSFAGIILPLVGGNDLQILGTWYDCEKVKSLAILDDMDFLHGESFRDGVMYSLNEYTTVFIYRIFAHFKACYLAIGLMKIG